jgi:sporulation protein YlmC with PRC-barrel domain
VRLGDVLETPVLDQDGRSLGAVHDVHLVQDGPVLPSGMAALRLHGLVVGKAAFGTRLGYASRPGRADEGETRGPWPIRAIVRWLHRSAVYVPWTCVLSVASDHIVVDAPPGGFTAQR